MTELHGSFLGRNFTSVARNYQLAYCQTVIERNNRINLPVVGNLSSANVTGKPLLLDCYFPFDPYRLPNSKHWINEFYRLRVDYIISRQLDN